MRVKTFRGETMQGVLALVRQEMGPEAVILGNQTVREDGKSVCEVMAALDEPAAEQKAAPRPGNGDAAPAGTDWAREWGEIKGHLLALLKPRLDFTSLTPRQRLALEYLEREGVEEAVTLALFRSIKERGETTVMPALDRLLAVRPFTFAKWPQPVHLLAGPSGVGKTTALLRLALAARKKAAGAKVAVINADGGRGKGRLVLRHYADLSGLTYAEAGSAEDFARLLGSLGPGDKAFVDAPALRGEATMEQWARQMGLAGRSDLAGHLVLSPAYAPAQLERFLRQYRFEALSSFIWTKLDEACNFGSLVNMAHSAALPVSALAFGPELIQGMVPASSKAVWKLLFKHQLPGDPATTATAGA